MKRFTNIEVKHFISFHLLHNVHTHYVSFRSARLKVMYDMYINNER